MQTEMHDTNLLNLKVNQFSSTYYSYPQAIDLKLS